MKLMNEELETDFWESETLIAELSISESRDLKATIAVDKNGNKRLNLRYYSVMADGTSIPTRKGILIDVNQLDNLIDIMNHAKIILEG